MKLLIDARFWRQETGGIGRYSRELVKELLKLNTDDEFHILIRELDEPEFTLRDKRVTKHVTTIGHYTVAEQLKLPRLIDQIDPKLVHYLNFNQPLFVDRPRVTTIHDLTMKYFPAGRSQTNPIRQLAFNWLIRHAAHSDRAIAVSRATKIDVVRDLKPDPEKVVVVYEAADERFKPRPKAELNAFRRRAGLEKPYILFVNQWRPHKGLPELIAAFDLLKGKYKFPHQLVITGKPNQLFPDIPASIEASKFRGDILLPGFVPDEDLPRYYAAADVTAFPSYYEGFGLGVLESMQSGTPVVCAKTSSIPEVAGEAGYYVKPKDIQALAEGLRTVVGDSKLREKLSKAGLDQANQFSWARMAKETYQVYQDVLGR